jgi:hypothetical protein
MMVKMKIQILITCLFYLTTPLAASTQTLEIKSSALSLQYGFSLKALIELGKNPAIHISANSGVGSTFIVNEIYPTINAEVQLYSGGLGTRKPLVKDKGFTLDFIMAFTVTAGFSENLFSKENLEPIRDRNIPLYYFSNYSYPSLINPYRSSVSLGSNLIWSNSKGRVFQRIGFMNLHINRVQASYYNDGGAPIDKIGLGDKKDRYYTGGGTISYHGPKHTLANLVEVSYYKFTGYSKNSYEVASHLQHAYVSYKEPLQQFFNRSLWSINVANPQQHWGLTLREYNRTKWDAQHLIHWSGYSPYHLVPHPRTRTIVGQTYFSQTKIGLR